MPLEPFYVLSSTVLLLSAMSLSPASHAASVLGGVIEQGREYDSDKAGKPNMAMIDE